MTLTLDQFIALISSRLYMLSGEFPRMTGAQCEQALTKETDNIRKLAKELGFIE